MSLLLDYSFDARSGDAKPVWPTLMSTQLSVEERQMRLCGLGGTEDADASVAARVTRPSALTGEPVEGWDRWAKEVMETLGICESIAAVDRVQSGKRPQLRAISRERPDLYAALGECFSQRRQALLAPVCPPKKARKPYGRRDRAVVSNDRETNFALVEA